MPSPNDVIKNLVEAVWNVPEVAESIEMRLGELLDDLTVLDDSRLSAEDRKSLLNVAEQILVQINANRAAQQATLKAIEAATEQVEKVFEKIDS